MNLKQSLIAIGAALGASALALTPTLAHASGSNVVVGDPLLVAGTAPGSFQIDGILKSASVSMKVFGATTTLGCSSGTAAGIVQGGAAGAGSNASHKFSALNLSCDSFLPGDTVTMAVKAGCTVDFKPTSTVTAAKTDLVTGTINATQGGTNCIRVTTGTGCSIDIGGATAASLDENKKPIGGTNYNELTLSGSGFTVAAINTPIACLGAVTVGSAISPNVKFNIKGNVNYTP